MIRNSRNRIRIAVAILLVTASVTDACPDGISETLLFVRAQPSDQFVRTALCVSIAYQKLQGMAPNAVSVDGLALLDEGADIEQRAAAYYLDNGVRGAEGFFDAAIQMRTDYLSLCHNVKDPCKRYDYNYVATLRAFDRLRRGQAANEWMLNNAAGDLHATEAVDLWLKALYSCPKWDMSPQLSAGLYTSDAICSEDCRDVADAAVKLLGQLQAPSPAMMPKIRRFTRQIDACSRGGDATSRLLPRTP